MRLPPVKLGADLSLFKNAKQLIAQGAQRAAKLVPYSIEDMDQKYLIGLLRRAGALSRLRTRQETTALCYAMLAHKKYQRGMLQQLLEHSDYELRRIRLKLTKVNSTLEKLTKEKAELEAIVGAGAELKEGDPVAWYADQICVNGSRLMPALFVRRMRHECVLAIPVKDVDSWTTVQIKVPTTQVMPRIHLFAPLDTKN